jgi:hypothetical protein
MKRLVCGGFTILWLMLLLGSVAVGVRSFFVENGLQWCLGVRQVNVGPIQARIVRYEVSVSRGLIAFGPTPTWARRPDGFRMTTNQSTWVPTRRLRTA